ncbi:hypothetical protein BDY17DRAFT_125810 [Neohortaea acidophila]|uniref:Uncharacterized protein n=1 Tax=Neohortaea acidophila TaxID=245834 RepID=A0A6A6PX31_9PEZI|nr:uncharacterized protein BDY17DRAFT_125810 [Neohortaea acidophila]KAF2484311.1 hypothetical protein BDY17DRAFT_125810 [Neohortaea acidophila]
MKAMLRGDSRFTIQWRPTSGTFSKRIPLVCRGCSRAVPPAGGVGHQAPQASNRKPRLHVTLRTRWQRVIHHTHDQLSITHCITLSTATVHSKQQRTSRVSSVFSQRKRQRGMRGGVFATSPAIQNQTRTPNRSTPISGTRCVVNRKDAVVIVDGER